MSIIGTRPPLISETNLYELHHRGVIYFVDFGVDLNFLKEVMEIALF